MNGILAMSELLSLTCLDTYQSDLLSTVRTSAGSMMLLVNDLLTYLKLQQEVVMISPTNVNLTSVLHDIQLLFSPSASKKGIHWNVECDAQLPVYIITDADRLKQVCIHILPSCCNLSCLAAHHNTY
jgi:signal transduction histidine kinase